ncbi:MAG: peptidylprolyl isomerase [Chloroflexi bacterium]|nr:peptidylprolyl isomerase [Chloroflexota bacterium]
MTTPAEPGPQPEQAQIQPQAQDQNEPAEHPTRRSILAGISAQRRRNRPYVIAGWIVLLLILGIPAYGFVQKFVFPPRELALRVENVEYTRGDLVDYIRFHQRISEELGQQFQIGSSLFDALQTMSENEMAFQGAPGLGVTVETEEADRYIRLLLGFFLTAEEAAQPENKAQIDEKKRQFLNNVRLTEETYREIARKELFREKVRERLAADVDRIQEQVHVYEIRLGKEDKTLLETIRRRLKAGETFSELALKHSIEPNVRRNNGELGWVPRRVFEEYDRLFFDEQTDGSRILPMGEASELIRNPRENYWSIFLIDDHVSAREVEDADFEVLKDRALQDWFSAERQRLDVHLVLNDRIYNWVNRQVRLASILPTPTPYDPLSALGGQ